MIFPIHKEFVDMIFDGSKDLEFRNKLPKDLKPGMKIYFYEALGKTIKYNSKYCSTQNCNDCNMQSCHEGQGMIVGEATVGRIDSFDKNNSFVDFEWLQTIGYNNHKYAIKQTNVIKYDEPIPKEEFISWNKYEKLNNLVEDGTNCPYMDFYDNYVQICNNDKYYSQHCTRGDVMNFEEAPCVKVTHAPQAPMYVVEIPYDTE